MTDNIISLFPTEFERCVESALNDAKLYDIGSYGWLNENDADPDFIGHAMWQVDQPKVDYSALFGDSPVNHRPEEIEKQILTFGEDFCGLMQASRLSIGLSLVWLPHAKNNILNESTYYWLHHMDALIKLAMASDRLRDLLIVACSGEEPKVYKKTNRQNRLYETPFSEAARILSNRGLNDNRLSQPLADLPGDASAIFEKIRRRNTLVHEISTRIAKQVQISVTELQRQYDKEQATGFKPRLKNLHEWFPNVDSRMDELVREIDAAARVLHDWYLLLVNASNNVFQIEYWSRALGRV